LNEAYSFDITDMQRYFSIIGLDAETVKAKKQKIDIVVIEAGSSL